MSATWIHNTALSTAPPKVNHPPSLDHFRPPPTELQRNAALCPRENRITSSEISTPVLSTISRPAQTTHLCRQAKKTFSTPLQQPATPPPLQHREPPHHHASDETYTCCSLIPAPLYSHTLTCPQRLHTYAPPLPLVLSLLLYILYSTLHK